MKTAAPRDLIEWMDAATVVGVVLSAGLALGGNYRDSVGNEPFAVSWVHALFVALAIAAVRHAARPSPSILASLSTWRSRVLAQPAMADAMLAFWCTRPIVLLLGFFAVVMIGLPSAAPESAGGRHALDMLPQRFDSNWYVGIALDGYEWQREFDTQQNLAFFPAYPGLIRAAGFAAGAFREGLPREGRFVILTWCGLGISLVAFFWAAWYFSRLAREMLDDERARIAVLLLAAYPFALFFSAAYSEAVFLLAALATWFHFRRGQTLAAVAWGLLAGLVRSTGCLLSVPLGLIAIGFPDAGVGAPGMPRRERTMSRLLAAASPGIGMLLFTAYLHHRTGVWFAWARAHAAWGRVFSSDAPARLASAVSSDGLLRLAADNPYNTMNALGLTFALAFLLPVWRRVGAPWALYVLVSVVPPLFAGGLLSMGRLSSTLFPLFLACAAVVPPRAAPAVLVAFGVLQGLLAALFYTWREMY
jgi:hypothetical protein